MDWGVGNGRVWDTVERERYATASGGSENRSSTDVSTDVAADCQYWPMLGTYMEDA